MVTIDKLEYRLNDLETPQTGVASGTFARTMPE